MLPEPTIPEPQMGPLAVLRPPTDHPRTRLSGAAGTGGRVSVTAGIRKGTVDLLAVTPERFRRALWRSFLRYGVPGDLDNAVRAAMSVLGPVLEARDAEITRLRELAPRVKRPARSRAASAR
jgi:hypothetical protein